MYINAGNAGLKRRSKVKIVLFQKQNARSARFQCLKSARWVCPKQERDVMNAAMIRLTGGCGSCARLMKARCGSSGARNAERPGGSIIKKCFSGFYSFFHVIFIENFTYQLLKNILYRNKTDDLRIAIHHYRDIQFLLLKVFQ
jgi:hypothetical protein